MICSKCGTDNDINNIYCTKCGTELKNNNIYPTSEENDTIIIDNSQKENDNDYNKNIAIILGIISLVLYFFSPIIINRISSNMPEQSKINISSISGICRMAGVIIMIFGRIKYPNSKFLKGVMWSIIVSIVLLITAIIILIGACYGIISYGGWG